MTSKNMTPTSFVVIFSAKLELNWKSSHALDVLEIITMN